jgi:lipase
VCLHGVSGHAGRFRALGEDGLTERRVLAPDLRGHGESSAEPPWTVEAHVADALETASAAGVRRAEWLGFSFGGRVAAALAAAAPERVERLILLDPALQLPPDVCLEQAESELEDVSFATADEAIDDRLAAGTIFHTPRELLEQEMRENLVRGQDGRLRHRHSRVAAIGAWSEMAAPAPPVAAVPTLIVRAERSWIPVDLGRYPNAEVVTVPGGHSVLWDAFEETVAALRRFLGA